MWAISLSVLPIFLLLVLGNLLRRNGFPSGDFWHNADRVVYWVLFPALLFYNTTTAPFQNDIVGTYALALLGGLLATGLISLASVKLFGISAPIGGAVFQGAARHNTFIAFAVADYLFHAEGLLLAAVATAVLVPPTNLFCVSVLVGYQGSASGISLPRRLFQEIIRNPLLIAIGAGAFLNFSGIGPIPIINDFAGILAKASLPIALLCVGAGLKIKAIHTGALYVVISTVCKLAVFPAIVATTAILVGLDGIPAMILIIYGTIPTASSGYALAKLLGADAEVMAGIITVQTLISMVTLPLSLTLAAAYFLG
ncbi:AEC family transporter [uncultured Sneathiella sp.]|uniref:AEC family transporter n=1 Tax=uncultured Sneathiella sp. TaxID=879315 RepID=UPI0030EC1327|tara:strand:- start:10377 stop:11312 length:936 start_codon:yes stop_codon:yes gene_type:complete